MNRLIVIIGKLAQKLCRKFGYGGSSLPGLLSKISPNFSYKMLKNLKYGSVIVSGTNGKTTNVKIATELLEMEGLKVLTNKSGSNMPQGIITGIIESATNSGKLDYDIAIFEVDEAYTEKVAKMTGANRALFLNVFPDQADRYGDTEHVKELLQNAARVIKDTVIVNADNPYTSKITGKHVILFDENGLGSDRDAAGAVALCHHVLPDTDTINFERNIKKIAPAYGRGEILPIDGLRVRMVLIKNPASFNKNLERYKSDADEYMIAVNNNVSDGYDTSWLDDVSFGELKSVKVVTGMCANILKEKLEGANVEVQFASEDVEKAVNEFIKDKDKTKCMFVNYTAMLEIRKQLLGNPIPES